jgi:hypothetical protein
LQQAFNVLSSRTQPSRTGPGSRGNSLGKAGRLYSWYYQHFEPADRDLYPASATDLYGSKGRLFIDHAEMACKWCNDQKDRYIVKYKPSTNLKHHLLNSCDGFQESYLGKEPDVVVPKAVDRYD